MPDYKDYTGLYSFMPDYKDYTGLYSIMPNYKIICDYTVLCRIIKIMPDYTALCRIIKFIPDYTALCRIITNNFVCFIYTGLGSNPNYRHEKGTGRLSHVMTQCTEKSYGGASLVRSLVSPCYKVEILRQY